MTCISKEDVLNLNEELVSLRQLADKLKLSSIEDSLLVLKTILRLYPLDSIAHEQIGHIYSEISDWNNARFHLETACKLEGCNFKTYFCLANVFMSLREYESAILNYKKSLDLQAFPEGLLNLSAAYSNINDNENRLKTLIELTDRFDSYPEGFYNLGVYWLHQRDLEKSIANFKKSLSLNPGLSLAKYGLSHAYLSNKDYINGFYYHESRWGVVPNCPIRSFNSELWNGQNVSKGSSILVYIEQGYGDTIQMLRYLPLLNSIFEKITVEIQAPLYKLVKNSFPFVSLIVSGEKLPLTNFHCPTMSLPFSFRTTADTIPINIPYLHCEKSKINYWKNVLNNNVKKIGLVWSGSPHHQNDINRSLPVVSILPIINNKYEWHSLQKEYKGNEEQILQSNPIIHQHQRELNDFSDTAGLIYFLDLIISVDTSVAHLAASMGKKVIIILNEGLDWRWNLYDQYSIWYPNARLFRAYELKTGEEFNKSLEKIISEELST